LNGKTDTVTSQVWTTSFRHFLASSEDGPLKTSSLKDHDALNKLSWIWIACAHLFARYRVAHRVGVPIFMTSLVRVVFLGEGQDCANLVWIYCFGNTTRKKKIAAGGR
jgi:hypothetical protein